MNIRCVLLLGLATALLILVQAPFQAFCQDEATSPTAAFFHDAAPPPEQGEANLRFNFRDAPLDTVLDYMSQAAGFAIIRETNVSGRVDIVSHQPLSRDEAFLLLNTVLNKKGYTAIRNDRILTIISRDEASKSNIPVRTGRTPEDIPMSDEMVTQIIPVRYANAGKIIDNIKPLLPSNAVISSNESSNAVILTDSQAHIRRMVEIIRALDTSISEISVLRVFMLQHADAADVAKMITDLFKSESGTQQSSGGPPMPFFGRRSREDSGDDSSQQSEALQAASRIIAVADESTNAVVVSAPEDAVPVIEKLIRDIDVTSQDITEVRVFPLKNANAEEMVDIIKNIFGEQGTTAQAQTARTGNRFMRAFFQRGPQQQQQQSAQSERKKIESAVYVQADSRTNSLLVNAAASVMPNIETVIRQLDSSPAKGKKVFIYNLKNADAATVTEKLNEIFDKQASQTSNTGRNTTTQRNTSNARTNRNTGSNTGTRNTGTSSGTSGTRR